jgi:hypothetical protein
LLILFVKFITMIAKLGSGYFVSYRANREIKVI